MRFRTLACVSVFVLVSLSSWLVTTTAAETVGASETSATASKKAKPPASAAPKKPAPKPATKPKTKPAAPETPSEPDPGAKPKADTDSTPETTDNDPATVVNDAETGVRELDISCPAGVSKWQEGRRMCADPSYATNNNAKDIAQQLDQAVAGIRVRAIDGKRLLISWKGPEPKHAMQELERMILETAARTGAADPDENRLIRLYNNRNASQVADALQKMFDGVDASAVGDDVILLKGKPTNPSQHPFSNIDRMVARLDLPRPQVTLSAWSLQMSSKDPRKLNEDAHEVQEKVKTYNLGLQNALVRGWNQMRAEWEASLSSSSPTGSARAFRDYVANVSLDCGTADTDTCIQQSAFHLPKKVCTKDRYCLGFSETFDQTTPSITRMLLFLVAAEDPKKVGDCVVRAMASPAQPGDGCASAQQDPDTVEYRPSFRNLHVVVQRFDEAKIAALRAAYADFLFNYKWSVVFPNDFVPYDLSLSASILDSQLDPFMTALNDDISEYLDGMQEQIEKELNGTKGNGKDQLYSTGVVSVRAISGLSAEVDTKTASFFNATPPLTVNDVAKSLKDVETSMPTSVRANLGANAAAALMAGLTAEKPAVARVGRGLTLKTTPISLSTASAAELDVSLDANEDDDSKVYFKDQNQSTQIDDTSRVAQHSVSTHVRVESMKLFELSSFSASLRTKNRSFPLLPPFVELPYIGSLVRFPLHSDPVFHRSFAIVSAIVVPTAADLAFGIPFFADRKVASLQTGPPASAAARCLYAPPAAPKNPSADEGKTGTKKGASGKAEKMDASAPTTAANAKAQPAASASGPPNAPPDEVDKDKNKDKDQCGTVVAASLPAAPESTAAASAAPSGHSYVVHLVGSASELNPAVRPYHKKMIECLKNWNPGECANLTFDKVELEGR